MFLKRLHSFCGGVTDGIVQLSGKHVQLGSLTPQRTSLIRFLLFPFLFFLAGGILSQLQIRKFKRMVYSCGVLLWIQL